MKISIHTTITNPERWQYPYIEALKSFCDVADEVIIVDGGSDDGSIENIKATFAAEFDSGKMQLITLPWPWEYTQSEFPKHLNAGLEACTGDWAIKCDIDYIFHENQINDLKVRLRAFNEEKWLCASMDKFSIISPARGFRKAKLPFIIHKSITGSVVKYGIQSDIDPALDDWCYPIIALQGKFNDEGVPIGTSLPVGAVKPIGIDVWNYDYFFRTKELSKAFFQRTSRAWRVSVSDTWGKDDEDAWKTFEEQAKGRWLKQFVPLELSSHPKYIRDRVAALTPEQFGYNNWGLYEQGNKTQNT